MDVGEPSKTLEMCLATALYWDKSTLGRIGRMFPVLDPATTTTETRVVPDLFFLASQLFPLHSPMIHSTPFFRTHCFNCL